MRRVNETALFVGYGGGHTVMLTPVIRALQSLAPNLDCELIALTTGRKSAIEAGLTSRGYSDFLHLVDREHALRHGRSILKDNENPDVSRDETLAYLGVNYLDLVEQHGEAAARELYLRKGRYGFLPLSFMRKIMEDIRPDILITTSAPRSEQAAIAAAKALGIPSICLVNVFAFPTTAHQFLHRAYNPDVVCVMASTVRDQLIAAEFDPASIHITGNSAFDGLFSQQQADAAARFIADRNWSGKRPILWAARGLTGSGGRVDLSLALAVEQKLREIVASRDDLALILRYHPGTWHLFPRPPDTDRVYFSVPNQEPLHPMLLASDVVVVEPSTVGVEAAVVRRPVISIEVSYDANFIHSLEKAGVGQGCRDLRDLPELLHSALSNEKTQSNRYAHDGNAALRIAEIVLSTLEHRTKPTP